MTKAEEKQRLRAAVRALERQLPERYKPMADRRLSAHLLAMPDFQAAGTPFCFVGTPHEIDTRPILEAALAAGKVLCVPLCTGPGIMELRQIRSLRELVPGPYGILEPPPESLRLSLDAVDFAVIPCLTCDRRGHRLGHGGGFYDRFLAHYRSGTVLLCRERLLRDEIPLEPHDYPIPWILTERGLYEDGIPARLG